MPSSVPLMDPRELASITEIEKTGKNVARCLATPVSVHRKFAPSVDLQFPVMEAHLAKTAGPGFNREHCTLQLSSVARREPDAPSPGVAFSNPWKNRLFLRLQKVMLPGGFVTFCTF
jgi:hypothetical protein